jgi:hypothetical protein
MPLAQQKIESKPVTSYSTVGDGVAPLVVFVVPFVVIGSLAVIDVTDVVIS